MKELVIATNNKDKLKEIARYLDGLKVKLTSSGDYPEVGEIAEDGNTFVENAIKKAATVAGVTGKLAAADDSGLEVAALSGEPGVRSSRYAGEDVTYKENNLKLLKALKGVPTSKRTARFICVVAVCDRANLIGVVKGTVKGKIAAAIRGRAGFGYDPLFIPDGYTKTFAELGPAVKDKISHRAKAFRAARQLIVKYLAKSP